MPSSEKAHRVTRLHADAQNRANRHPPAWVFRLQQTNEKIGSGDAPEIVERDVLEYCALYERNGRDPRSHSSEYLDMSVSAEFLRNQTGQHHDHAHSNCGEDPKTGKRRPEED